MSETPMNMLRALCEKLKSLSWDDSGLCTDPDVDECADELRAILPDVERLETEVANLKAHRVKFEKSNGELTDYAYLCKLEGQVERLVELLQAVREELQSFCIDGLPAWQWIDDTHGSHPDLTSEIDAALALFDQPVSPKETPNDVHS